MDVVLGDESGFDLARQLEPIGSTVVLISTHAETDIRDLIPASCVAGFVPKSELSAAAVLQVLEAAA